MHYSFNSSDNYNNHFFTLTALETVRIKIPEAIFATVATTSFDVFFAVTASGLVAAEKIRSRVTYAVVQGSTKVAVAGCGGKKGISLIL